MSSDASVKADLEHERETLSSYGSIVLYDVADRFLSSAIEIKKVLKPDVFQEFELEEKTVISHNVAM